VSLGAPLGDALLAGTGVGLYPNLVSATRMVDQLLTRYQPQEAISAHYDRLYPLYRKLYTDNESLFGELARISS
jgi:sugar (pentulose or hexulose) kinase